MKQLKDLKSQLAQLKTQLEESLIEQQRLEGKLSTTETWQVKRGGKKIGRQRGEVNKICHGNTKCGCLRMFCSLGTATKKH